MESQNSDSDHDDIEGIINIDDDIDAMVEKLLNESHDVYSSQTGWDQRYKENSQIFEWYHPWSFFSKQIKEVIGFYGSVLHIGCGSSQMSIDLLEESFSKIINIDISSVIIEIMRKRYSDLLSDRLEFVQGDCLNLPYSSNSFDFVIDKGTFDALLCSNDGPKTIKRMLLEVIRVLKPSGFFIEISYGSPDERKNLFEKKAISNLWTCFKHIDYEGTSKETRYYTYIYQKRSI